MSFRGSEFSLVNTPTRKVTSAEAYSTKKGGPQFTFWQYNEQSKIVTNDIVS